ncbi:MAG: hypothetical protein V4661_15860 [Pseudomonadota bacterium]
MSAIYTPGPWEFSGCGISSKDGYADILYVEDGHVYSEYTSDSASLEIPNPANISLILAAPDLLEALEAMGSALGTVTVPKGHPLLAASEKASAAIAKARTQ